MRCSPLRILWCCTARLRMRRFGWRSTAARSAARRCPSVPLTPSLAATSSLRRCLPRWKSSVRTRRHRRCCGSTMETVCATVGLTRRLWNLRSICSAIQRAFTSSRASTRETRGVAARFLASAQAQIIICIPLSSMPISIFGTPGAYSPSSVHGMLPSLSAVTWRTWRKMSALLVSYSS